MRGRSLADRTHRPIRRHPFAGRVGQSRGETDQRGFIVDRGRLRGGDLVLA